MGTSGSFAEWEQRIPTRRIHQQVRKVGSGSALQVGVPKQQLHGTEMFCPLVAQPSFGAAQRVGAVVAQDSNVTQAGNVHSDNATDF